MSPEITFMKLNEVATYLRLSRGNVYLKVKQGLFPSEVCKKIGKSYRFDVKKLNEWINSNGVSTGGNGTG